MRTLAGRSVVVVAFSLVAASAQAATRLVVVPVVVGAGSDPAPAGAARSPRRRKMAGPVWRALRPENAASMAE